MSKSSGIKLPAAKTFWLSLSKYNMGYSLYKLSSLRSVILFSPIIFPVIRPRILENGRVDSDLSLVYITLIIARLYWRKYFINI